ncbi:MAG: hypothetical protein ABWY07_10935 [Burkholderiales bacterium]
MRSTLIALATAGLLASGGAAAGTAPIQVTRNVGSAAVVPVQYSQHSDRWDDRSANVNEREARIKARIERGLHDGRITNLEARRLYRELASIEAKERAFRADGRLSYREDAELKSNLDRLAENVRVQLRDDERRYSYNAR